MAQFGPPAQRGPFTNLSSGEDAVLGSSVSAGFHGMSETATGVAALLLTLLTDSRPHPAYDLPRRPRERAS